MGAFAFERNAVYYTYSGLLEVQICFERRWIAAPNISSTQAD